jgi:hypothetical protein
MNSGRVWVTLGLAVGACGGEVSKGDSTGSSVHVATGLETTTATSEGTAGGSAAASTGPFGGGSTPSVASSTTANGWAMAASSSPHGETSSTAFVGSGSASTAQSYSQNANAPLADDAGHFPWITCYGQVDGSSCLISDINGGSSIKDGVHSVDCSATTGMCSCLLSPQSPWAGGRTLASFPFTSGTCPVGSTTSSTLGSVDPSACASRAAPLFARCGW